MSHLAFRAGKAEVLDDGSEPPSPTSAGRKNGKAKTCAPNIKTHLMAQSKERLAGWLMELAARDGALLERLKLDAATANPAGDCIPIWRRRVDRLTLHANQSNYAPAAESLQKMGQLMKQAGQGKRKMSFSEVRLTRLVLWLAAR